MNIKKSVGMLAIILSLSAFGTFSMPDDADARRFGSSRSIGRTTTVKPSPSFGTSTTQQQNFQQRSMANQQQGGVATMNRGGLFGGLFGGLLAGTLLGSLLMGGGFAGGGLLDIIIIGLIAYFGFKFFRSRNQNRQDYNQRQNTSWQNREDDYSSQSSAWDNLRSERQSQSYQDSTAKSFTSFNEQEFLDGAKKLYVRMQESWDLRDLQDIKEFTTELLFNEVKKQYEEDPTPSKTELLLVNASLLDVKEEDTKEYVAVLFDVLMKEQENENNEQVKEIWNFTRDKNTDNMWKLDGIQQV